MSSDRAPRWAPPLLAVQFLTRVPVPALARLTGEQAQDGLSRAMAWLPLVGTAIGCATAGVFVTAQWLWTPVIAVLLALAAEALLTGAFHEDALADFCDAFGGVARGETALRIMRDSRIGTYGGMGLGLGVALRAAAMVALPPPLAMATIVAAATAGRLWAVWLATILPPVAEGAAARMGAVPMRRAGGATILALPGLMPLALASPVLPAVHIGLAAIVLSWLARFLGGRIGGTTGDCLGFAAFMGQLSLLLIAAAA